jgi:nicotinamidase-related amidase
VYVVGVALDFCVGFSSLDAISLGYKTTVVRATFIHVDVASFTESETKYQKPPMNAR